MSYNLVLLIGRDDKIQRTWDLMSLSVSSVVLSVSAVRLIVSEQIICFPGAYSTTKLYFCKNIINHCTLRELKSARIK